MSYEAKFFYKFDLMNRENRVGTLAKKLLRVSTSMMAA